MYKIIIWPILSLSLVHAIIYYITNDLAEFIRLLLSQSTDKPITSDQTCFIIRPIEIVAYNELRDHTFSFIVDILTELVKEVGDLC